MEWAVRLEDNTLTHYGVKGMRWGVRKEPEIKGIRSKKLNAVTITEKTDKGNSKIRILDKRDYGMRQKLIDDPNTPKRASYASEAEALYKLKNLPRFNMRLSRDQQAIGVNHNAPDYNRTVNCFECTMAYEMRRRGYNVQANSVNGGYAWEALHAFDIKDSFNLTNVSPEGTRLDNRTLAEEAYNRLEEQCLRYGDGARGMLAIYYAEPYDGGHALTWTVENGKFKILDNQNGTRTEEDIYNNFLYCDSDIDVYRLDNADILPGVTDFVEPFEATEREKALARKRYNRSKKIWKKEHKQSGKAAVENIIKDIGKNVSNFVSKGIDAIGKLFDKSSKSTNSSSNTFGGGGSSKKSKGR